MGIFGGSLISGYSRNIENWVTFFIEYVRTDCLVNKLTEVIKDLPLCVRLFQF